MRGLGLRTLGTAAFDGFDDSAIAAVQFVRLAGGHAAGVADKRLGDVADYAIGGALPAGEGWTKADPAKLFEAGVIVLVLIILSAAAAGRMALCGTLTWLGGRSTLIAPHTGVCDGSS